MPSAINVVYDTNPERTVKYVRIDQGTQMRTSGLATTRVETYPVWYRWSMGSPGRRTRRVWGETRQDANSNVSARVLH